MKPHDQGKADGSAPKSSSLVTPHAIAAQIAVQILDRCGMANRLDKLDWLALRDCATKAIASALSDAQRAAFVAGWERYIEQGTESGDSESVEDAWKNYRETNKPKRPSPRPQQTRETSR